LAVQRDHYSKQELETVSRLEITVGNAVPLDADAVSSTEFSSSLVHKVEEAVDGVSGRVGSATGLIRFKHIKGRGLPL